MKYFWFCITNLFLVENATARGWHSNYTGPDWFNKFVIGVLALFLAYLLVKRPIKTIGVLLGVIVFPALMLLTVGQLDNNLGFPAGLVAVPVMWFAILKFVDLFFKKNEKNNDNQ